MDPIAMLALLSDQQQEIMHLRNENTKLAKAAENADAMREHIAKLEASGPCACAPSGPPHGMPQVDPEPGT